MSFSYILITQMQIFQRQVTYTADCPDHKTKPYLNKSIELIYFIIESLNIVHS
jgi:hypothetical protein